MTEDNKEKIGFFRRAMIAIKDFDHYGIFASEKLSTAVKYLLIILLLFTIIIAAVFTYQFSTNIKQGIEYYHENIDTVSYNEGKVHINHGEVLEIQNDQAMVPYILIATDINGEEISHYQDKLNGYQSGILLLNNRIIYKNQLLSQNMEYHYEDIAKAYGINSFQKEDVDAFIQNTNQIPLYFGFFIMMFIYLYLVYLSSTFVDIMMLAVLGFIIARIAGMRVRFKASFQIGIYALTLPIILNLIYMIINVFTGFHIRYFSWMYTTISYIYVIVAILMIKTDFIHKQIELQKLIEEQEKVKQEMQRKEEEKKQEEEKQNKEKKDTKEEQEGEIEENPKKKEKPKKDNNLGKQGLAPQEAKNLLDNQ